MWVFPGFLLQRGAGDMTFLKRFSHELHKANEILEVLILP